MFQNGMFTKHTLDFQPIDGAAMGNKLRHGFHYGIRLKFRQQQTHNQPFLKRTCNWKIQRFKQCVPPVIQKYKQIGIFFQRWEKIESKQTYAMFDFFRRLTMGKLSYTPLYQNIRKLCHLFLSFSLHDNRKVTNVCVYSPHNARVSKRMTILETRIEQWVTSGLVATVSRPMRSIMYSNATLRSSNSLASP